MILELVPGGFLKFSKLHDMALGVYACQSRRYHSNMITDTSHLSSAYRLGTCTGSSFMTTVPPVDVFAVACCHGCSNQSGVFQGVKSSLQSFLASSHLHHNLFSTANMITTRAMKRRRLAEDARIAAASIPDQPQNIFLNLPQEIRDQVYTFIFKKSRAMEFFCKSCVCLCVPSHLLKERYESYSKNTRGFPLWMLTCK